MAWQVFKQNAFSSLQLLTAVPKGQLISECLFDVLNFPKQPTQRFDKSKNLRNGQINKKTLSCDAIIYI